MNPLRNFVLLCALSALCAGCATEQERREQEARDRALDRQEERQRAREDAVRAQEDRERDRQEAAEAAARYRIYLEEYARSLGKRPSQLTAEERAWVRERYY